MMDSKTFSNQSFSSGHSEEVKVSAKKSVSFWIDLFVKLIGISFFILSLSHVLRASDVSHDFVLNTDAEREVVINVHADDFPPETSWRLLNAMASDALIEADRRSLHSDKFYSYTIFSDTNIHLNFIIKDVKEDGVTANDFNGITMDKELLTSVFDFEESDDYFIRSERQSCNHPQE